MNKTSRPLLRRTAAATALAAVLLGACGDGADGDQRVTGAAIDFNGAKVTTWAIFDAAGTVQTVGFNLPYSAVQNAVAASTADHDHPVIFVAAFPKGVAEQTFIDHFEFDWMPTGHEPARYATPHFDFHFYGVTAAAVAATTCTNPAQLPLAEVPDGWFPSVPPGVDPLTQCAPNMGYHSPPATEFDLSGPTPVPKPELFDKVMIAGNYGGTFTFIEPMITKAELDKKASFTLPVPQPKNLGRATRYPTTFQAIYDPQSNSYDFVLGGFKPL